MAKLQRFKIGVGDVLILLDGSAWHIHHVQAETWFNDFGLQEGGYGGRLLAPEGIATCASTGSRVLDLQSPHPGFWDEREEETDASID